MSLQTKRHQQPKPRLLTTTKTGIKIGANQEVTPEDEEVDDQMETVETVAEKRERLSLKKQAHITKTKYLQWQMRIKEQLTKSLGSELTSILIIIFVLGTLYFGTFIAYLWVVHIQFTFALYYPQFSTQQPGPGQDQRFNIFWFLLFFSILRLPLGLAFIWLMRRLGISWKLNVYIILFITTIVLEVFTLIVALVLWALCNNPYMLWDIMGPTNMCNDRRYCEVYGNDYPNNCPAGSFTGLSADVLRPNTPFIYYLVFNGIFIFLSALMFIMVPSIMDFKENSQHL